jgi:hypothetical protein
MAARFWVGGTGTWDAVNTANWSATSGGAGGASVPTSADNIVFNASSGGGTVTLGADGICTINDFTGFTGTIDFVNTYKIVCVANNTTIVNAGSTATFSNTPRFDLTYSGAVGTRTISCVTTEANSPSFYITAGTDIVTGISRARTVDFTGFSGSLSNAGRIVYGNLIISTGMTLTAGVSDLIFGATSGTQLITTNNKTFDFPITKSGAGTIQLQDNLTMGSTRTFTLTAGTLDLSSGNRTLSTGLFASNNSNVRSILFGTGAIELTGNAGIVWTTTTATNFTYTGTPTVNLTYSGSVGTRTINTGLAGGVEANSPNFNVSAGTDIVLFTATARVKNVNFTGFSGTYSGSSALYCFGDVTFSSGMTVASAVNATFFVSASNIQKLVTNGKTLDFPITVGVGSSTNTLQLQDNLTMGATRTLTLTSGTIDLTGNSGNWTLSTGIFSGTGTVARSILFGTGNIELTGNGATIWNATNVTNFSYTGTPTVNCTYAGSTGTRTLNPATTAGGTQANSISFNITAGTDIVTFFTGVTSQARNVNFTGFSGTFSNNTLITYGSVTFSAGMTLTAGSSVTTFASTAAGNTITTNGKTLDFPITFNGVGGVWACQDALTQGSTRAFTITNGTVQLKDGVTSTVGSFVANNTAVKFLQSTTPGSQATLSQASGTVNVADLTIRDINAVGGASWNAYTDFENTDAGNNDGWNFSLSPPYSTAELPVTLRPFTQPRRF